MAKKKKEEVSEADLPAEETMPEVPAEPEAEAPAPTPAAKPAARIGSGHVAKGSKAEAMRDHLHSQPKVRVLIPLAPGEKMGVTQSVILNGYPMYIRKGEYVEVPQQVAEILEERMKQKMLIDNHPDRIRNGEVKLQSYGG